MPSCESAAFQDHFQDLTDPRVERTRKHPLINIVFIAVCGVLSGANSFAAIEEFGLDRRTWFARFLDLTNGIPSDDTFARVLARIDPGAFEKCLLSWMQAVQEITDHRLIAIDGKVAVHRGMLYFVQYKVCAYEHINQCASIGLLSHGPLTFIHPARDDPRARVVDGSAGVRPSGLPGSTEPYT